MRPLVVFTGQGVARADGFNLTRRVKSLGPFATQFLEVPWRDRQNLDELFRSCGRDGELVDELIRETRAICLKQRRTTQRKTAHRALFQTLAAAARHRLVVHLTANVDGLTSTFAARDFGARWEPYHRATRLEDLRESIAEAIRIGVGLVHLPVHGEAALVASVADGFHLRTFHGDPATLRGHEPWVPTLRIGLAADVRRITETFPVAALGYDLLRSLVLGEPGGVGTALGEPLPGADLMAIGYGAGSRASRSDYPFERTIDDVVARGAPSASQRFTALVYEGDDSPPSRRWYGEHGFAVVEYGDGEIGKATREALVQSGPGARSAPTPGERAEAPSLKAPKSKRSPATAR